MAPVLFCWCGSEYHKTIKDALAVVDNKAGAELWNLKNGELLKSFELQHNRTKEMYTDAVFLGKPTDEKPGFALTTNQWLKMYNTDFKESYAVKALYDFHYYC